MSKSNNEQDNNMNNNSTNSNQEQNNTEVVSEHVEHCKKQCDKLQILIESDELTQPLLEGAKKDYIAYIASNPFEDSEREYVFRLFAKASKASKLGGIGVQSLNNALKKLKKEKEKANPYTGYSDDLVEILKACEVLQTASGNEQRSIKKKVWKKVFKKALLDAEIKIVVNKIAEYTSANYTPINAEWKQARAKFIAEELEKQRKKRIETSGKDLGQYHILEGKFHRMALTKEGDERPVPLCNFVAEVTQEIVYDNNGEQSNAYKIAGKLCNSKKLDPLYIPSAVFKSMAWIHLWSKGPSIEAGMGTADHVRSAIDKYSGLDVPTATIYTHTGWREVGDDKQWVFLHEGGAIGAKTNTDISVKIGAEPAAVAVKSNRVSQDERLKNYNLSIDSDKQPLENIDTKEAIKASLGLLEIGKGNSKSVDTLLLGALAVTYRAPLGECIENNFTTFIVGRSGIFKSQLTALMQAHYGAQFNGECFPEGWDATVNNMEKKAFLLKDCLEVIDDFNFNGGKRELDTRIEAATRFIKNVANRSGRGRLNPDGSIRFTYIPMSLPVISAEDYPKGYSIVARAIFMEMQDGDIVAAKLSIAQENARTGLYAYAMAKYLEWLAPQINELKKTLPSKLRELRNKFAEKVTGATHRRSSTQMADLYLSLELFFRFCLHHDVLSEEEVRQKLAKAERLFIALAAEQNVQLRGADPTVRFVELLIAALSSGKAHLESTKEDNYGSVQPIDPNKYGWRIKHGEGNKPYYQAQGERIGWVGEKGEIYLQGDSAYKVIQEYARAQGDHIAMSKSTLYKRMKEKGMLLNCEGSRNTTRIKIQEDMLRVIYLVELVGFSGHLM